MKGVEAKVNNAILFNGTKTQSINYLINIPICLFRNICEEEIEIDTYTGYVSVNDDDQIAVGGRYFVRATFSFYPLYFSPHTIKNITVLLISNVTERVIFMFTIAAVLVAIKIVRNQSIKLVSIINVIFIHSPVKSIIFLFSIGYFWIKYIYPCHSQLVPWENNWPVMENEI